MYSLTKSVSEWLRVSHVSFSQQILRIIQGLQISILTRASVIRDD